MQNVSLSWVESMQLSYVLVELDQTLWISNCSFIYLAEPLIFDALVDVLDLVYVDKLKVVQLQRSDQHKFSSLWIFV